MKRIVLCLTVTAFAATGAQSLPHWPVELQGPTLHGMKPWAYVIWNYNDPLYGGDVCYPSLSIQHVCRAINFQHEADQ